MDKCGSTKWDGTPCKGTPIHATGWCVAHHPEYSSARKQGGAKGGRRAGSEMFLFGVETADALPERWPPVPKVYAMLAEAEAVRGALEELLRNPSGERALFVHFRTSRSTQRFLSASGASCPHREGEST